MMRKSLAFYLGMSARAATVVTLAALLIFTAFGSFHWRLWWLVPPVWLVLFVLSLLLAPAMGVEPAHGWMARLPWFALVLISLLALFGVILGVETAWTRVSLALLAATGLGAGVYAARAPFGNRPYRGRERRRNLVLRAKTDELLGAIRKMHRVSVEMEQGTLPEAEAQRSLDRIEGELRDLLAQVRDSVVKRLDRETEA